MIQWLRRWWWAEPLAILRVLASGPAWGADIGATLNARDEGMSRGRLYSLLASMEDAGLVTGEPRPFPVPFMADTVIVRRHYAITDAGRARLAAK